MIVDKKRSMQSASTEKLAYRTERKNVFLSTSWQKEKSILSDRGSSNCRICRNGAGSASGRGTCIQSPSLKAVIYKSQSDKDYSIDELDEKVVPGSRRVTGDKKRTDTESCWSATRLPLRRKTLDLDTVRSRTALGG